RQSLPKWMFPPIPWASPRWDGRERRLQGATPVKGFHLTNGWLPDAVKRLSSVCRGVVWSHVRPDGNALRDTYHSGRAFTSRPSSFLMRSGAARGGAKVVTSFDG